MLPSRVQIMLLAEPHPVVEEEDEARLHALLCRPATPRLPEHPEEQQTGGTAHRPSTAGPTLAWQQTVRARHPAPAPPPPLPPLAPGGLHAGHSDEEEEEEVVDGVDDADALDDHSVRTSSRHSRHLPDELLQVLRPVPNQSPLAMLWQVYRVLYMLRVIYSDHDEILTMPCNATDITSLVIDYAKILVLYTSPEYCTTATIHAAEYAVRKLIDVVCSVVNAMVSVRKSSSDLIIVAANVMQVLAIVYPGGGYDPFVCPPVMCGGVPAHVNKLKAHMWLLACRNALSANRWCSCAGFALLRIDEFIELCVDTPHRASAV